MKIKIRHQRIGQHVHAKVYCNGAHTGKLTLRPEEFNALDEMLSEAAFQLRYHYYEAVEEEVYEANDTGGSGSSTASDNDSNNNNN